MRPGARAALPVTLVTTGRARPLRTTTALVHLCFSVPHNFRLQSRSLQVCRGVSGALRYFKLSKTVRLGKRDNELIAWTGLALGQEAVFRKKTWQSQKFFFLLAPFGSIGTRQIADGQWLGQITGRLSVYSQVLSKSMSPRVVKTGRGWCWEDGQASPLAWCWGRWGRWRGRAKGLQWR